MQRSIILISVVILVSACTSSPTQGTPTPEYNPFIPLDENGSLTTPPAAQSAPSGHSNQVVRNTGPTPTLAPVSVTLPPPRGAGTPLVTPTPDLPRTLPTPRQDLAQYSVQAGDTLGIIAERYGVGLETLMEANNFSDANLLEVGQSITIPPPETEEPGPGFKIIPDSELVYGPSSVNFDIQDFIQNKGGYLSSYTQDVDGEILDSAEIVQKVAQNYSVSPRLLLALIEHRSHWVTDTQPPAYTLDYPLGFEDTWHEGLYRQLTWAANELNRGYYLWRVNAVSTWVLADGSVIPIDPTINAGTAGVQQLLAKQDTKESWYNDVEAFGLFQTFFFLFGSPFDLAIEPLIPGNLSQPVLQLPFENNTTWSYTGGPHGGWDSGSAWAALDFAPPGEAQGCILSDAWITAMADGWIVRTGHGIVIQDLDGDGLEQTGWAILYMHVDRSERVQEGTYARAGDHIGHPSCEGGVSNGTHVHIARKYNGEWISADTNIPFVLDGWVSSGDINEYDGYLTRNGQVVEAWNARNDLNQIQR